MSSVSTQTGSDSGWETVIGLEIHAQLKTNSKLFCSCPNLFGGEPNSRICPVCSGMPGALPVINSQAVALAVRAGLALGCRINLESVFSRKSYYYPDLPNGFQTSQLEPPICESGLVRLCSEETGLPDGQEIRINRIHMEDDAGKCLHEGIGTSLVDLNRAGTPLIEIVTEPDLRSPEEAVEFLRRVRRILVYLDVTDGNMEEGSFRCDVNISLRRKGASEYGIRSELKNLNSFNSVLEAGRYEVERQTEILEAGGVVDQETRLYDPDSGTTRAMRSKEEAPDYRYFPNPDLPPVLVRDEFVETERKIMPEMPELREKRYQSELGLHVEEATILVGSRLLADYFEEVLSMQNNPKRVAGIILGQLLPEASRRGLVNPAEFFSSARLAEAVRCIDEGKVSLRVLNELFGELLAGEKSLEELAKERGLVQVSDSGALEKTVLEVIAANPAEAADYRAGKKKLMSFFVGQVMKATRGAGNPALINQLLGKHLG